MSDIATKLTTIAENQQKVHDAGHAKGHEAGLTEGYNNGYSVGVTVGKQAEREAFWEDLQSYSINFDDIAGERTDYCYAFYRWTEEMYKPIKRIVIASNPLNTSSIYTFACSTIKNTKVPICITNYKCAAMFAYSTVETIPYLSIAETSYSATYSGIFLNAIKIKNITYTTPIYVMINYQWCTEVTVETLRHTMDMLYDYAGNGQTGTYKITFGSTNLAKLTDDDLSVARNKGWTVN